jgi:hypothetical protein
VDESDLLLADLTHPPSASILQACGRPTIRRVAPTSGDLRIYGSANCISIFVRGLVAQDLLFRG